MSRNWLWLLIAAPMVMVLTFMSLMVLDRGRSDSARPAVRVSGEADIGGPFTLVDHTGRTVTEADFLGRPMLIYFGYTYCPDVCPFSLQIMDGALRQMDPEDAARIQPILISIDPERDTVDSMAAYVASPAFPDGLVGLTGSTEQVAAVLSEYRVVAQRAEDDQSNDYLMDHSSFLYLMDSQGKFADVFPHGTSTGDLAARLQDFLETDEASS